MDTGRWIRIAMFLLMSYYYYYKSFLSYTLLLDLLILNEPSKFYDQSIVIYILEKCLHTDFVATRKSAVHR